MYRHSKQPSVWISFAIFLERRIGERSVAEVRVRIFNGGSAKGQLQFFDWEDYMQINLVGYF